MNLYLTIATTVVVYSYSLCYSVLPRDWYILYFPEKLLIIKLKSKTETRVQPRETAPEIRIQESREVDREVVYLNPETAHKNEDLTHSYCEVDKSRSP